MDAYTATLEYIGDSIIGWADPDQQFTGFTKVRIIDILISTTMSERTKRVDTVSNTQKGILKLYKYVMLTNSFCFFTNSVPVSIM